MGITVPDVVLHAVRVTVSKGNIGGSHGSHSHDVRGADDPRARGDGRRKPCDDLVSGRRAGPELDAVDASDLTERLHVSPAGLPTLQMTRRGEQ